MIYIENKRKNINKLREQYPNAHILDITSKSTTKYAQLLSPFYPHGNIPIPYSPGMTAASVEGIWQGLKVFEHHDIDLNTLQNRTMTGLKRTTRKYGNPLGHRNGINGTKLLGYFDARMKIYIPSYKWVLDNIPDVHNIVLKIAKESKTNDIVLLDYNTNCNVHDLSRPMSHAGLLKLYIEGRYPIDETSYPTTISNDIDSSNE